MAANLRQPVQTDRRWEFARLCRTQLVSPVAATRRYLEALRAGISRRPVIAPLDQGFDSVQQIPTVRAVHGAKVAFVPGGQETALTDTAGLSATDGLFRWSLTLIGMVGRRPLIPHQRDSDRDSP